MHLKIEPNNAGKDVQIGGYSLQREVMPLSIGTLFEGVNSQDESSLLLVVPSNSSFKEIPLIHPYILTPDGFVQDFDGAAFCFSQFPTTNLKSIDACFSAPLEKKIEYAIQLAETLAYLHQENMLFLCIHPKSILIHEESDQLKWIGLYNKANPIDMDAHIDTVQYISPEQTGRVDVPIDYRADIYSLGLILYELFCGCPAFTATNSMKMCYLHIAVLPQSPCDVNHALSLFLSEIIMKCLKKSASERYQSASGLAYDLKHYQEAVTHQIELPITSIGHKDRILNIRFPSYQCFRQVDLDTIIGEIDTFSNQESRFILIQGESGIGKTILLQRIGDEIKQRGWHFAYGKCEQQQSQYPLSCFVSIFVQLIQTILRMPNPDYIKWQQKIRNALAPNEQIMVQLVPDLEKIIGKPAPAPHCDLNNEKIRFMTVVHRFIQLFCTPNQPLVIALDDLQWADDATHQLLSQLRNSDLQPYLIVIAARREESHITDGFFKIKLAPLDKRAVVAILDHMFGVDQIQEKDRLAELLLAYTQGILFHLKTFVSDWIESDFFTFDSSSQKWKWDIHFVRHQSLPESVFEINKQKLKSLSAKNQKLLFRLATYGYSINTGAISAFLGEKEQSIQTAIALLIKRGFLFQQDNRLCFIHDQIYQYVYSSQTALEKQDNHYQIAQEMLMAVQHEQSSFLFDCAYHIQMCLDRFMQDADKFKIVQLYVWAAQRAMAQIAYDSALSYVETGLKVVGQIQSESTRSMRFELNLMFAHCAYLLGNNTQSLRVLSQIDAELFLNSEELVRVAYHQIRVLISQGQQAQALEAGFKALAAFGFPIQKAPGKLTILFEFVKIKIFSGYKGINIFSKLSEIKDQRVKDTLLILSQLISPAFEYNKDLMVFLIEKMVLLSVQHGIASTTSFAVSCFGIVLGPGLQQYAQACNWARLGIDLAEKSADMEMISNAHFVMGHFILGWCEPLSHCIPYLNKSYELSHESGHLITAAFSGMSICCVRLFKGDLLSDVRKEAENHYRVVVQNQLKDFDQFYPIMFTLIDQLSHPSDRHPVMKTEADLGNQHSNVKILNLLSHLMLDVILNRYDRAIEASIELSQIISDGLGTQFIVPFHFYSAMAICGYYQNQATISLARKRELKSHMRHLHQYAKLCPQNVASIQALAKAMQAWLYKKSKQAEVLFEQAISLAIEHNQRHIVALANESASLYYAQQKNRAKTLFYQTSAGQAYGQWGAYTKERQLLSPPQETSLIAVQSRWDFAAVLQSSQEIAREKNVDQLLIRTIQSMMIHSGAQTGYLIIRDDQDNQLYIQASADAQTQSFQVLDNVPLAASKERYFESVISFVARDYAPILFSNASEEPAYLLDPYIIHYQPKSVLCQPMLLAQKLAGIIYLENNLTIGAFSKKQIDLMSVLASQAVISLENSRLFQELGEKIDKLEAGTTALQKSQKKVVQLEKALTESQLSAGFAHEIRNALSGASIALNDFVGKKDSSLIEAINEKNMRICLGLKPQLALNAYQTVYKQFQTVHQHLTAIDQVLVLSQKACQRGLAITNKIQDYSKIGMQKPHPKIIDLTLFLTDYTQEIQDSLVGKNIDVKIKFNAHCHLEIEEIHLYSIVHNIVKNAIDAMQDSQNTRKTNTLSITVAAKDDFVLIAVQDTGVGMTEDQIKQVFTAFYSTKPLHGTGLGLSIVKKLVDLYEGDIHVESNVREGTLIQVTLPKAVL